MQIIQQVSKVTTLLLTHNNEHRNFYAPGSNTPGLLIRMETADSLTFVACVSYVPCTCMRTLIKTEKTIEKTPNLQKLFLNTRTSLRQTFNAVACSVLELFRRRRNPKNLWWCPIIKREKTTEKLPNFQEIFMNTRSSLRQNFDAVACFVLELFRRLRNPKNLWWCLLIKREQTIEKLRNF